MEARDHFRIRAGKKNKYPISKKLPEHLKRKTEIEGNSLSAVGTNKT